MSHRQGSIIETEDPTEQKGAIFLNYEHRVLTLETAEGYGKRMPFALCGQAMDAIGPLFGYAVRMAVEGASAPRGGRPRWLHDAADVRLVDYGARDGATLLHVEAPLLGAAAPELFEQRELWPQAPPEDATAVDLLAGSALDIRKQNPDSSLYDLALLHRMARLRLVFTAGLRAISLPFGRNGAPAVPLDQEAAASARLLSERTPPPREVRVVGKLDMIRYSTRSFALKMTDGTEVRGVLEGDQPIEIVGQRLGQPALVLGRAVYRPSGTLLRIDARAIETGEGQPTLWEKVPPPMNRKPRIERLKPGEATRWLDSFFGKWPGEETEEDLLEALRELRG